MQNVARGARRIDIGGMDMDMDVNMAVATATAIALVVSTSGAAPALMALLMHCQ